MTFRLYRCTECGNVVAQRSRPGACLACGDSGGFHDGSAFERIDADDLRGVA